MSSTRRSSIVAIIVLLVAFAAGLAFAVSRLAGERLPLLGRDRIALVPLSGVIGQGSPALAALKRYRKDPSVKGYVLVIDSPGGAVGTAQSLYREVKAIRDEDREPVIAWIGDVGASGGYYVALGADSIFTLPGSITGSIGVIMEFPNAQELLKKVGVGFEVVKSGAHKDMGSPYRSLSEGDRRILQGVVDDVFGQFVDVVTENRHLARDSVLALADGRIFSGRQARELGLVDRTGSLGEAIDAAGEMSGLGKNPPTVRPHPEKLTLMDLLGGVSRSKLDGWLGAVASLPERATSPRLLYEWR